MNIVLALLAAYLLGSIPSAFVAGKLSRGIDLRRHGSGNLGATNAFRLDGVRGASAAQIAEVAGFSPAMATRLLAQLHGDVPTAELQEQVADEANPSAEADSLELASSAEEDAPFSNPEDSSIP